MSLSGAKGVVGLANHPRTARKRGIEPDVVMSLGYVEEAPIHVLVAAGAQVGNDDLGLPARRLPSGPGTPAYGRSRAEWEYRSLRPVPE